MVEDTEEPEPLSAAEIEDIRSHLDKVRFRERVRGGIMRWSGRLSAAIITGFALYKAVADLLWKKGG